MAVAAKVGQAQVDGLGVRLHDRPEQRRRPSVPHLHIHVIPRTAGKPLMFVENEKGDSGVIEATAAKIRAAMKP